MTYSTTRPPVSVTDGEKIRQLRESKLRVSCSELARRVGINPHSMINIEKGRRSPSLHLLQRIALELDEPLAALLRQPDRAVALPADELGPPGSAAGQPDNG
jgi:DNA-binding XRE family transcriptional regulator